MEKPSVDPVLAPGYVRMDIETEIENAKELRKKKRIKYLLYFIAFCIFQTGVIVLMTLTIMKMRTPKFVVRSASWDSFSLAPQTNPSFNLTMNVQFGVKNTNFGTFKFQETDVFLYYKDSQIGQVTVPKATALWRSTKKINVVVNVNSSNITANSSSLSSDLSSGVLPITALSNLNGKIHLVQMFKKKKTIKLNCSLQVTTKSRQVNDIACIT